MDGREIIRELGKLVVLNDSLLKDEQQAHTLLTRIGIEDGDRDEFSLSTRITALGHFIVDHFGGFTSSKERPHRIDILGRVPTPATSTSGMEAVRRIVARWEDTEAGDVSASDLLDDLADVVLRHKPLSKDWNR